jgi:hypothetical protein
VCQKNSGKCARKEKIFWGVAGIYGKCWNIWKVLEYMESAGI